MVARMKITPATTAAWAAFILGTLFGAVAWDALTGINPWKLSDWASLIGAAATVGATVAVVYWQHNKTVQAERRRLKAAVIELSISAKSAETFFNKRRDRETLFNICNILSRRIDRHADIFYRNMSGVSEEEYFEILAFYGSVDLVRDAFNSIIQMEIHLTENNIEMFQDVLRRASAASEVADSIVEDW